MTTLPEVVAPHTLARLRTNSCAAFHTATFAAAPRRKRSPSQWAQQQRWLSQGSSPLSQEDKIRFSLAVTPWCKEPLDSAIDPQVEMTVLWWASNMAKTDGVAANLIGYCIDEAPCPIIINYPIDRSAEKFSKDVLQGSLIDATPCLRSKVAEAKSRDSGNTISHKRFAGGSISVIASGSASAFRLGRAGFVYGDEIDAMPGSVGVEGDPIFLLLKRADGFPNAIKLLSSTATIKGKSRIEWWYGRSDQQKWFCPCRKCGHLQWLKWAQVRWPQGKLHLARYHCEQCDAEHDDAQRVRMVLDGKWQPTAPFTGIRGYWLNGINSTMPANKGFLNRLHQFAKEAELVAHAQNPVEAKTVWTNTFLAETVEAEIEPKLDYAPLLKRKRNYRGTGELVVPRDVLVLTIGADVHPNRVEATLCGFTTDEQMHILESETLAGDPESRSTWASLDQWAGRKFKHETGATIEVAKIALDTGHKPDAVYAYGSPRSRFSAKIMSGRVLLFKGLGTDGAPVINARPRPWRLGAAGVVNGYMVGTNAAKEVIYARLRLVAQDGEYPPCYIHFAETLDEEFFRQLTVEQAAAHYERGRRFVRFVNPERQRNEAIDMVCYALAAFRLRRWDFAGIEEDLAARAAAGSGSRPSKPKRSPITHMAGFGPDSNRDNWVLGGHKW